MTPFGFLLSAYLALLALLACVACLASGRGDAATWFAAVCLVAIAASAFQTMFEGGA